MTTREKICIFCKRDCSDRDRVIDEHGRYACRVCLDAAKRVREMSFREVSESSASRAAQPPLASDPPETSEHNPAGSEPGEQPAASSGAAASANKASPDATAEASAIDELRAAVEELRAAIQPGQAGRSDAGSATGAVSFAVDDDDDMLPPLLDDPPPANRSSHPTPTTDDDTDIAAFPTHDTCPACGGAIPPFALLCVHCGTDTQTGQRIRAAGEEDDAENASDSNAESGSPDTTPDADGDDAEPELAKAPRPSLGDLGITGGHLLAVLAALLTGGAWILLRADLGTPLHRFGLFVGVAVGLGMYFGHGRRSLDAPRFAIAVTLLGVLIGVIGSGIIGAQQRRFDAAQYTDEHKGLSSLADEIVIEWRSEDRPLEWPPWGNPEKVRGDFHYWPNGYPASVEAESRVRWASLSDAQRADRLASIAESQRFHRVVLDERKPTELIWIALGLLTAWLIGVAGVPELYHRFIEKMS